MYGDQFGEFVCGYWGLKVNNLQFDEMMYIVPACPEKTYFDLTAQWQLPPNVFPFFKI